MNKRVWSMILLCLIFAAFISTIVVFVNTGISLYQVKNTEIDTSNDMLSGASIIGAVFATIGLWIGFIFIGSIISSIGFLCSLINFKISEDMIIKRISKAFSYFYLVILTLIFTAFLFVVISVF